MKSFRLIHKKSGACVYDGETLYGVWKHIRNFINMPSDWKVTETEHDEFVDSVDALYLIENFKDENTLPESIIDIWKV